MVTADKTELTRTVMVDGIVTVGELEFTALMVRFIRAYKFLNDSNLPTKIVFPDIGDVEGVRLEFPTKEVEDAITRRKPNTRK